MKKWDERFLDMARMVATWSKDPSTKCGAVLVDTMRRVVGTGYNGFPRGVHDAPERYSDRMVKYKMVVHAEANAILNAIVRLSDATLYSTKYPCSECAKLICQSGIAQVVCPARGQANDPDPSVQRWAEDAAFSNVMMTEAGIIVQEF